MQTNLLANGPRKRWRRPNASKSEMTLISASRRTDIPAYYSDWFMDKIKRGFCQVVNPYNAKIVETITLDVGSVDGIIFWSRDYSRMASQFEKLAKIGYRFYFQYTIIGYPEIIDPGVPEIISACKTAHWLAGKFGRHCVVWRYDPIVLTSATDAKWHKEKFTALCRALEGATDTCVISFIDMYKKLDRNFFPLLDRNNIILAKPQWDELEDLAVALKEIAENHGIHLTACCEPRLDEQIAPPAKCVDVSRLEEAWKVELHSVKKRPTRAGCCCVESKDIGAYNRCPAGCAYCYANQSQKNSAKNRQLIMASAVSLG